MSRGRLLFDILDERDARLSLGVDGDDEQVDAAHLARLRNSAELAALDRLDRCGVCGYPFRAETNLLGYHCRIHTGVLSPSDGRWTCCGKGRDFSGCRPSMHASMPEIVRSMRTRAEMAFVEIPIELIDYNLVKYNVAMILNTQGGSPSLIHIEDENGQVKRRQGYFYFMRRVNIYERVL